MKLTDKEIKPLKPNNGEITITLNEDGTDFSNESKEVLSKLPRITEEHRKKATELK